MANETIGHVNCAHCGQPAEVRRYKTGARKLYYHCHDCGQIRPSLASGQRWIEAHATWIGADASEPAAPVVTPAPAANESQPVAKDERKPKRRSFFGGVDL
ncbi:MAG: hypothetical protein PF501_14735 [Salinisphaera sp.]|jgi:hypothetical protein|nr:hypothetical protein [Salinisphaera sp.]